MKILNVNSTKFFNIDRLHEQVQLALIRYGYNQFLFEIGDMYTVNGTIKLKIYDQRTDNR